MTSPPDIADAAARETIERDLDATLIVEAAAGTGKTTALVGRIVRIISEGRSLIRDIVAVTFTEKAAGELKLRLREQLDTARQSAAAGARERLDLALHQLEEAHIGTIHAFCADLLRERPVEAGIDPLFEVLTEPASARLFDEAFGRWLQDVLADPPEGVRRALRRSSFGGDDGPVDRLRKAAWDLAQWRDFTAPWTRNPFNREADIDGVVRLLHETADLTRNPASRNDPLFYGTDAVRRLSDEIGLQQAFGDDGAADYDGWESGLADLSRDRALAQMKQGRGASYRDGVPRERVLAAVTELRSRVDQLRMDADADLAALLQIELRGALEYYRELKARDGALDFLDLLLVARDLVRGNQRVRAGFRERFHRIFVDEFQDTDPLQAEILLLLAADNPGETDWRKARPLPGRLFLVGDPKQSIYRFRRADVAIYREVCERLEAWGATLVRLTTSFRSVPEIQSFVNAAFAPIMTGDATTLQASYVPLSRHRPAIDGQPAIVALPVPEPYARRYVSGRSIEQSLPGAVGAMVEWIVNSSGWKVTERSGSAPVPVSAKHICLLFRRFVSWEADVTRPYVDALEVRGIPHVLVGGRAFHEREEVEAIRAALTAIEWPDDELSVFRDAARTVLRHRRRRAARMGAPLRPAHRRALLARHLPSVSRPGGLRRGHAGGDRAPAPDRRGAVAAPAAASPPQLRPALARRHDRPDRRRGVRDAAAAAERDPRPRRLRAPHRRRAGARQRPPHRRAGASVPDGRRHLLPRLRRRAAGRGRERAGVRGADPRRRQRRRADDDRAQGQGAGVSDRHPRRSHLPPLAPGREPLDRRERQPVRAETRRLVADRSPAARLRRSGARQGRRRAARVRRRHPRPRPPRRAGDRRRGLRGRLARSAHARHLSAALRARAANDGRRLPGVHVARLGAEPARRRSGAADHGRAGQLSVFSDAGGPEPRARAPAYSVVWWDPRALRLDADSGYGLRRDDLISRDGDPAMVAARLAAYEQWREGREEAVTAARMPSMRVRTATSVAVDKTFDAGGAPPEVEVVDFSRSTDRPFGARFGTLVHAVLAAVPLNASERIVSQVAQAQSRIVPLEGREPYVGEEVYAAVEVVTSVLRDSLFDRVRLAERAGRCERELPITWKAPDGTLIEGAADLVFEDLTGITVIDFKTDRELAGDLERYRRQLSVYCQALGSLRGTSTRGILARI